MTSATVLKSHLPQKKKKRTNEEESNSFSSSVDESVVRICFPGIDCCCTQHKRVASQESSCVAPLPCRPKLCHPIEVMPMSPQH